MSFDTTTLSDMIEGENEWCNIQPVIRTSFKLVNDTLVKQQHLLKEVLQEVSKLQIANSQLKDTLREKITAVHLQQFQNDMETKLQQFAKQEVCLIIFSNENIYFLFR